MRAKDNLRYEIMHMNVPHDFQIKMPVSPRAKKINPSLVDYWEARLIEVEYAGKIRRYITSLTDTKANPFKDLTMIYIQH